MYSNSNLRHLSPDIFNSRQLNQEKLMLLKTLERSGEDKMQISFFVMFTYLNYKERKEKMYA